VRQMRTAWAARKEMGECGLRLLKEDPAGGGYKLIETIASVGSGRFYVGRIRDAESGALVEKMLVKESALLTAAEMLILTAVDVTRGGGAFDRYAVQERTPPIGTIREWICNLRANFQDATAIVP
jgi:hypothetical protein